ncbi:MAG: glucosyltransferase domain-containing protein [Lachnospiraceae bacterium]|nr:glucosyltransferase domain-containing protein [Lachnospiraceae bacterium]
MWILIAITTFICHGAILFSNVFGIDTEVAALGLDDYFAQGRQGIMWLRSILGLSPFNLYLAEGLTFFLMLFVPITYYFFFEISAGSFAKPTFFLYCIIFVVSPFWVAQIYFLSQSAAVLFGLLLIPVVLYLFESGMNTTSGLRVIKLICGIILFQFVSSTYQVNLLVYVAVACTVFVLSEINNPGEPSKIIRRVLIHGLLMLVGFIIYFAVTKLFFFSNASYLTQQLQWPAIGISKGIANLKAILKFSLTGYGLYGFMYWPIVLLAMLCSLVNGICRKKKTLSMIMLLIFEVFLSAIPFFFPILFGSEVLPRMRYSLPIVEACFILVLSREFSSLFNSASCKKKNVGKILLIAFSIALYADIMRLASDSISMYYTDEIRFEQEKNIASDLKKDISNYLSRNGLSADKRNNLLFLGKVNISYNDMCLLSEATIGSSALNWDYNMMSRGRLYYFMDVVGYPIGPANHYSEGSVAAFKYYFDDLFGAKVDSMPCYPNDGYIEYMEDPESGLNYLIVKLGNDWKRENIR